MGTKGFRMATKQEILDSALAICAENNLEDTVVAQFTELLQPKRGGAQFNIEDVTKTNEADEITHILDSTFNVFLPVYDEDGEPLFYEKPDTQLGWSRFSRAAEKTRKDREKSFKATEKGIFKDLMADEITSDEAKDLMAKANTKRETVIIPEDIAELILEVE